MSKTKTRTITVNHLARVEGEGGLFVKTSGDKIEEIKLNIFEPPRFFEALLRGRSFLEVPDITARICGICPIAYQMSSCHAMENACGVKVGGTLRELRRVIYCGEWIQSHTLHITMLHAPDFLGYPGAVEMAKDHPEIVKRGLALKKIGNEIMKVIGGREIHPINVKVGGFYSLPSNEAVEELCEQLKTASDLAEEIVRWAAALDFPDFSRNFEFVSLFHEDEYPMNEGDIVSSSGLRIGVAEFEKHFEETHVPHSTALHSKRIGGGEYLVGPMARFHHNFATLTPRARTLAEELEITPPCNNPFRSIVIRALEVLHACDEAFRVLSNWKAPERASLDVTPTASTGFGCTEAPRGLLYNRFRIDGGGDIQEAKIVPPTSQNQTTIESDLRGIVEKHFTATEEVLTQNCERAIRNYDPCISCATHFLKLHLERH